MKIKAGDLLRHPDGTVYFPPSPDGTVPSPVFSWECCVLLDDIGCPCIAADEEAGEVVTVIGDPRAQHTEVRRGKVEIRWAQVT